MHSCVPFQHANYPASETGSKECLVTMVTRKWSHLCIIRALADARPSDIPVWDQMRGCLECHSLRSYTNIALGQALETLPLQKQVFSFFVRVGVGGAGRTEPERLHLAPLCHPTLSSAPSHSNVACLSACVVSVWGHPRYGALVCVRGIGRTISSLVLTLLRFTRCPTTKIKTTKEKTSYPSTLLPLMPPLAPSDSHTGLEVACSLTMDPSVYRVPMAAGPAPASFWTRGLRGWRRAQAARGAGTPEAGRPPSTGAKQEHAHLLATPPVHRPIAGRGRGLSRR